MTQSRHRDKRKEWGPRDTADAGLMVLGNGEDTEGKGEESWKRPQVCSPKFPWLELMPTTKSGNLRHAELWGERDPDRTLLFT